LSLLWLGLRQCGVSPWTLLGVAWILHLTQNGNGIWPIWDLIRIHGFWFALGAVLGITPGILERLRATPRSLAWIGLFLGFALTGWGAVNVTTSLLGASMLWAMPGLVASLWLAMSLPTHWPLTQALAWMGRLSLEIYLVHTLASATTRVILLHGFQIRNVTLHLILSLLAGILIPMALVLMTRRLQWRHIFRFGTVA
jgi:peptidoglycan/LPS O-acetylase OafA/YrhL